ncbi:hypothetical protein NLM59_07405 [Weeksellaceae bacterium KMM 9724]|uniref:hypothetical protein n=1 Tax=Profundicola chukchiensis TaxID=2961959 RepID=UPI00243E3F5D|nr:hypothetical protein [Profundicola chukchiensis]MDG4950747.1 hypothetical protein [Profundicola chukchiensis]
MNRVKLILLVIITCVFQKSNAQKFVTVKPFVKSTNVSSFTIERVEIYENKTKILIQVPSQKRGRPIFSLSRWTMMVESELGKSMESQGLFDYEMEMPKLTTSTMPSEYLLKLYHQTAQKKVEVQDLLLSTYGYGYKWENGGSIITDLGNDKLNTRYSIKSKKPKVFNFWLTFPKIQEGVESVSIYEFGKSGYIWRGIRIKNPE